MLGDHGASGWPGLRVGMCYNYRSRHECVLITSRYPFWYDLMLLRWKTPTHGTNVMEGIQPRDIKAGIKPEPAFLYFEPSIQTFVPTFWRNQPTSKIKPYSPPVHLYMDSSLKWGTSVTCQPKMKTFQIIATKQPFQISESMFLWGFAWHSCRCWK